MTRFLQTAAAVARCGSGTDGQTGTEHRVVQSGKSYLAGSLRAAEQLTGLSGMAEVLSDERDERYQNARDAGRANSNEEVKCTNYKGADTITTSERINPGPG
jgi:hypothetical protein